MGNILSWQSVRGDELIEAYGSDPVDSILPAEPAIYMWKRNLSPPFLAKQSGEAMFKWCKKIVETPSVKIGARPLSHSIKSLGFELVGDLEVKEDALKGFLATAEGRTWTYDFLQKLEPHAPPLYVGETHNLEQRTKSHMSGVEGFGKKILENLDLDWKDLYLQYVLIADKLASEKKNLKTMEYITQVLTISGFTTRAG